MPPAREDAPAATLTPAQVREVQLGVLAALDGWCREHGVTYHLAYGTLLGAVRHGGFIPWDDDVDVMMAREHYDRLVREWAADAPPHLRVAEASTRRRWPLPYAKLCDERTSVHEPLADPVELGVNVDVFPVDPVPAHPVVRRAQATALRFLRWALEVHYLRRERGRQFHGPAAIQVARPVLRLLPVAAWVAATTWVARHPGRASDRVGVRVGSFDWSVPERALGEPGELDFEHLRCWVPADADRVLTAVYGDYRTLPPEHLRVTHHSFTATRRAEPPARSRPSS